MNWKDGGAPYLPFIGQTEVQYDLPTDLLARIAYQECSWRPEVIDGSVKSPAGAVGMFQLMPQFFPGAGLSWQADAQTAAHYLNALHDEFKDWQIAVAAYNWGPGNVRKYDEGLLSALPTETEHYVTAVFRDVPISGALINA